MLTDSATTSLARHKPSGTRSPVAFSLHVLLAGLTFFFCFCLSGTLQAQDSKTSIKEIEALIAKAKAADNPRIGEEHLRKAETLRSRALRLESSQLGKLRFGFARADIIRAWGQLAEKSFQQSDKKNVSAKIEALSYFKDAAERYEKLLEDSDSFAERIEQSMGPKGDPEKNPIWKEALGMVLRADYHLAWAWYDYGALATNDNLRTQALNKAIDSFMSFTSNGWANDEIIAECFLGQAMSLYTLGEHFQVNQLLAESKRENTPPSLFKRISWLKIKNHMAEPSFIKADNAATVYFSSLPGDHKYDNIDLEMMLDQARALASLADPKANPRYHQQFAKRLSKVSDEIQKYGEPWRGKIRDILKQKDAALGSLAADDASEAFNQRQYKKSRQLALEALNKQDAKSNLKLKADLQYIAILSAFNADLWMETFEEGARFFGTYQRDSRRSEVGRLTLSAALRARNQDKEPREPSALKLGLFLNSMNEQLKPDEFPDLRYWVQAEVELDQNSYAKAAATLNRIKPEDDMYLASRYRIAEILSMETQVLRSQDPKLMEPMQAHRLSTAPNVGLRAVHQYLKPRTKGLGSTANTMDQAVAFLAIELMNFSFESPSPDVKTIQALITMMKESPRFRDLNTTEVQALEMRLASTTDSLENYLKTVRNFMSNNRELSPSGAQSLTYVSRDLERERREHTRLNNQSEVTAIDRELRRIYEKLTDFVRQQKEDEDRDERMIPIRYKLAATYSRLGEHQLVVVELNWILKQIKENEAGDVMRLLAIAYEKTGQRPKANELWRTLAKGLKPDSDPWLEARMRWVENTFGMGDRDHAVKLMKWTLLKSERWEQSTYRDDYLRVMRTLGIEHENQN